MSLIQPTFGGVAIFGFPVTMHTEDSPREQQINAFVGINGVEVLDLGLRLRHTHVRGRFTAVSEFALGALFANLRSFENAFAYTLVTTKGETFNFVKLYSVNEVPPVHRDGATGFVYQEYTAVLTHLYG